MGLLIRGLYVSGSGDIGEPSGKASGSGEPGEPGDMFFCAIDLGKANPLAFTGGLGSAFLREGRLVGDISSAGFFFGMISIQLRFERDISIW